MKIQMKLMSMIGLVLICILSAIIITKNVNRDIAYLNVKKNDALEFRSKWLTFTGVNKSLLITDVSEPVYQSLLRKHKRLLAEITETIININSNTYLKKVDRELSGAYRNTLFIWDLSRDNFNKTRLLLDPELLEIINKKSRYGSIIEIKERYKSKGDTREYLKLNELINRILSLSSADDSFNSSLGKLIAVIDEKITTQEFISQNTLLFVSIFLVLIVTVSLLLFGNQIIKNIKIVVALNKEIEERRRVEDELRRSEKYNRMLFEESSIGLLLCKMNGDFVDVNSACASIIGRTVDETLSLTYWDITPEKYAIQEQEQLDALAKTGRYGPYEKEYIHVDGHLVPVRLSGLILEKDGSKFIWSSIEDITKSKQAESDKESLQLELQQSQKMEALGKLSGGVAHEYNNMLAIIIGFSELLKEALKENSKLLKYTSEIQNAGNRAAKLTSKLLAFSRQKIPESASVNLNMLLQKQNHMLEKTLTVRINLTLKLEENLWQVWLDAGDMEDVILNLCINAMHAMEGSGRLTIETSNQKINQLNAQSLGITPGEYILLSITDTGCGMDVETQKKIFDPFFSTKGDKGTGLGLSMVYGFMHNSLSDIKVYSKLGEGTRFDLYFPRYNGNGSVQQLEEEIDHKETFMGNETILVVDDELSLLNLTHEILSSHGFNVILANSAKEALDILKHKSINIMISDVIMPEMDGYQLAAIVKEKYPEVKIQLASGFTDERNVDMVDEHLRNNVLNKPFSSQELLLRMRDLCSGNNSSSISS